MVWRMKDEFVNNVHLQNFTCTHCRLESSSPLIGEADYEFIVNMGVGKWNCPMYFEDNPKILKRNFKAVQKKRALIMESLGYRSF